MRTGWLLVLLLTLLSYAADSQVINPNSEGVTLVPASGGGFNATISCSSPPYNANANNIGDQSGALNSCINKIRTYGFPNTKAVEVLISPGIYRTCDSINATGINSNGAGGFAVTISGYGAYINADPTCFSTAGHPVWDQMSTFGIIVQGVNILTNSCASSTATGEPTTGFQMGRTTSATQAASVMRLLDVNINGCFRTAGFYNLAGEESTFINLEVQNSDTNTPSRTINALAGPYACILDGANEWQVPSPFVGVSTIVKGTNVSFQQNTFIKGSCRSGALINAGAGPLWITPNIGALQMQGTYLLAANNQPCVTVWSFTSTFTQLENPNFQFHCERTTTSNGVLAYLPSTFLFSGLATTINIQNMIYSDSAVQSQSSIFMMDFNSAVIAANFNGLDMRIGSYSTDANTNTISAATINIQGVGFDSGSPATGTMTWAGVGCAINPILNVTTDGKGHITTINSITEYGSCVQQPSPNATTWTPGGGLNVAGLGASFILTGTPGTIFDNHVASVSIAAQGSNYTASQSGTFTWAGQGCLNPPVIAATINGSGQVSAASVSSWGDCGPLPPSVSDTWTPSAAIANGGSGAGARFTVLGTQLVNIFDDRPLQGLAANANINAAGSGYPTSGPIGAFGTITNPGSNYGGGPTGAGTFTAAVTTGGSGTGCNATFTVLGGQITAIAIPTPSGCGNTFAVGDSIGVGPLGGSGSGFATTVAGLGGTLTWNGNGCIVNPVIGVATASGGVTQGTGVVTRGLCNIIPPGMQSNWTVSASLSGGSGTKLDLISTLLWVYTVNNGRYSAPGGSQLTHFNEINQVFWNGDVCEPNCGFSAPAPPINRNPEFVVDQVNEGATNTPASGGSTLIDGWVPTISALGSAIQFQRIVQNVPGTLVSQNYLRATLLTPGSISASNEYALYTSIEGPDFAWAHFGQTFGGVSNAQPVAIDLCGKATHAGTWSLALQNSAQNRSYVMNFHVQVQAINQCYHFNVPGDTTGTWLTGTGQVGAYVVLAYGAGSNFLASQAGEWEANNHLTTAGAMATTNSWFSASGTNTFDITSIHVYPGGVRQPYQQRGLANELLLAKRYYQKSFNQGVAPAQNAGAGSAATVQTAVASGTATAGVWVGFPVGMVTNSPAMMFYSTNAASANCYDATAAGDVGAASAVNLGNRGFFLSCAAGGGYAANHTLQAQWSADSQQ